MRHPHGSRWRRGAAAVWIPPRVGAAGLSGLLPVGARRCGAEDRAARRSRAQVDQRGLTGRGLRMAGTMTSRARVGTAIEDAAIIAVIRMTDAQRLRATVDARVEGGIRVLEVTMTVPGAVDLIGALSGSLPPDLLLGAGTVLDSETATRVIDAGAAFVVSPVFKPALIEHCHRRDIAVMPEGSSPTEIFTAWEAGADFVKVFPATALGP